MTVLSMLIKEMSYRKLNSILAFTAVTLATGSLLSALLIMDIHVEIRQWHVQLVLLDSQEINLLELL